MIEPLYLELLRFADCIQGPDYSSGPHLLREHLSVLLFQALAGVEHAAYLVAVAEAHLDTDDLGELVWALQALHMAQPEVLLEQALSLCLRALPTQEPRVLLLPGNIKDERLQRMNGVIGLTPQAGLILLFMAPWGPWDQWLPYVLAHEHHHSSRLIWFPWEPVGGQLRLQDGRPFTLLDTMVYEGLADTFAQELYPHMRAPWTQLRRSDEPIAWKRLRPRLGETDLGAIQAAMFGDGVRIPFWAGYALGYWIVQGFRVRYPQANVEDLLHMDARTIFRESGLAG